MAVDFGILAQAPSIGRSFMAGREAAQAEQERNMLRQQQAEQMQFQRENMLAQRDERAAQRQRQAELDAKIDQMANLIQQHGMDPDDPKVLSDFMGAAMATRNPQLIQFVGQMTDRAAQRRAAREEQARIGNILSPTLPPGPPLRQPTAPVNALAAPRQDLLAGTPFAIGPLAAPAAQPAPAAAPDNTAKIADLERQIDALEAMGTPAALAQAKRLERTVEKLRPKQETTPADIVTMRRLGYPETPEGYAAFQATKKPPAPSTTVVIPPQEKAERGERGKLLVEQYKVVSDAARLAQKTLPALETQVGILDKGFRTGFGTDVQKVGASVLAALGVPEAAKFATDAQTFLAATQQAVLQRQLEQKGPQTEADAQRITQTGAQLGNTPEANRFIIDVAKAQLKRDIEQRNFYDKWWQTNKTYDGAEDAWFSGDGNKSLFDRPELKKYAAPKPQAPAVGGSWRVVR